jgi:hypothetical protein
LTQYIYAAAPTIQTRWKLWFHISEHGAITEGDADEGDAGYNEPEKAKLARLFDLAWLLVDTTDLQAALDRIETIEEKVELLAGHARCALVPASGF